MCFGVKLSGRSIDGFEYLSRLLDFYSKKDRVEKMVLKKKIHLDAKSQTGNQDCSTSDCTTSQKFYMNHK